MTQADKSAEHLLQAFILKTEIKLENLLWLADYHFSKLAFEEGNFILAGRTSALLNKCLDLLRDPKIEENSTQLIEPIICKLANVYRILGRIDEEIALLESLDHLGDESKLLLADSYAKKGYIDEATGLLDEITAKASSIRSSIGASASLQGARLKLGSKNHDQLEIANQLKNLVIQKNILNEPLHLEAALEYVDLQAKYDLNKKLALMLKIKEDFQETNNLLSKDYHAVRLQMPEKNTIYSHYMEFIDANIAALQSVIDPEKEKLKEKKRSILLKLMEEPTVSNTLRIRVEKMFSNES